MMNEARRNSARMGGHRAGAYFLLAATPLLLPAWAGCERPIQPQESASATVGEGQIDALWDAALAVLSRYEFRPDRQDRAMGVIETRPTTSRQWGEFWRRDVADSYSMAEASLNTIQRKATVRFVRGAEGWRIEVQVDVYRLSAPETQITTASSALHGFDSTLPTTEGQVGAKAQAQERWVPLGRDSAVEERLLASILARVGE